MWGRCYTVLQLRKEVPVGFFDGLKRDSKQNQTIAGARAPQSQEQREAQADATYREPDPDELEVSMREVE